jgi:hypothetical protein
MHRIPLLSIALAALLLPVSSHAGEAFGNALVHVEAYVDEAPAGASVAEELRVSHNGSERVLHIVTARPVASDHPGRIFRDEQNQNLRLRLTGLRENVEEILRSEPGTKLEGTFAHRRGTRTLVVHDIRS